MGSTLSTSVKANDVQKKSGVKLRAQTIPNFNGNGIKWQSWKKMTRAAIGVAGLLDILDDRSYANKESNRIENETVFHLLQVATSEGNAAHLVDSHEAEKDGHGAYHELVDWYDGDALTTDTAEDVRSKIDNLALTTKNSASEYINFFLQYTKHLDELGESYTNSKTVTIFLDQIDDPDYQITKNICVENRLDIKECILRMRACERRITRTNSRSRKKVISIRRANTLEDGNDDRPTNIDIETYKTEQGFYSVPRHIWELLDDAGQQKVKAFNGKLRKERRQQKNRENDSNPSSNNRNVTSRRTNNNRNDDGDANPSPTKKQKTVQIKDDDLDEAAGQASGNDVQKSQPQPTENAIKNRREVLSFRVNENK